MDCAEVQLGAKFFFLSTPRQQGALINCLSANCVSGVPTVVSTKDLINDGQDGAAGGMGGDMAVDLGGRMVKGKETNGKNLGP